MTHVNLYKANHQAYSIRAHPLHLYARSNARSVPLQAVRETFSRTTRQSVSAVGSKRAYGRRPGDGRERARSGYGQRVMRGTPVFTPPPRLSAPGGLKRLTRQLVWSLPALPPWLLPAPAHAGGRLRVVRVKGDGRCLYRSIARSLASEEERELSQRWETEDADALRGLAYKEMCVTRAAEFAKRNIVEGNLRMYCSQMRNSTFFAGEAEILALSDALKVPISIFMDTGRGALKSIATYGTKHKKAAKGKTVRVLYNGTNHYNAVVAR